MKDIRLVVGRIFVFDVFAGGEKVINRIQAGQDRPSQMELGRLEVYSVMDLPWFLMEMVKAPKSCTPPMMVDPTKIQIMAGTQPRIITIAGPTIGPVPAMEA